MTQPLAGEDERVEVHLFQVLGRLLLQRFRAGGREGDATLIRSRGVGRQVSATMRGADLQVRKLVQRTFEDQMRQRDRRLERIADDVAQETVALHSRADVRYALRM